MYRLIVALLLMAGLAKAGQPLSRDYWLNESSLPMKVNALLQDNNGYIWAGTESGLYRFNGRSFSIVHDSAHKAVTALAAGTDILYLGYEDGSLGIVEHDSVMHISISGDKPTASVSSMCAGAGGILWLCNEDGIYAIMNGHSLLINKDKGLSDNFSYSICGSDGMHMLAGTDGGVNEIRLNGGKLQIKPYTSAQGLPDNIVRVIKKAGKSNLYWIGTQSGGVARMKDGQIETFKTPWRWGEVNDIVIRKDNRAWVATTSGYLLDVEIENNDIHVTPFLLESKKINKLILTKTGTLWCATNKGLTAVTAQYASCTRVPAPYVMDQLTAICVDTNNKLWFSQNEDLYYIQLRDSATRPVHVSNIPARITCLHADKSNSIWIGTLGKGVWRLTAGYAVQQMNGSNELKAGNILSITNRQTRVWVAGLNGVEEFEYKEGKVQLLKHYNKQSGIGSDYVYQLYTDKDDNVWMATDGAGICMYNGNTFYQWNSSTGFNSKVIYSITQDAQGYIWAATLDSGLVKYSNNKWQRITKDDGLRDINISSIAATATGQVVIVHQKGIDEWYSSANDFRHFSSKTGLDIDSVTNVLNCSANDKYGNVYVPYDKGFILFRNYEGDVDFTPVAQINNVSVFFKPVIPGTEYFDHDANHITFKFEAVSFTYVQQMHYRYKLEGYNDTWIITNDEAVTFPQLPPGHYTFRIQASVKNNFEKYSEASYSFEVGAPFWQRPFFLLIAAIALVGIVYLYIKRRDRQMQRFSQLRAERMTFEYEHLKSQVNPHFLFNSLNTLTNLIDEDSELAIQYTTQLSDLYRLILTLRDKDMVLLADEMHILDAYLYIQKSRFGEALRVHIDIPKAVLENKKVVPLAVQLLVENAIKHNIVSRSEPLSITVEADEESISVRNTLQVKLTKEKSAGLGLINIYKRYRLLTKRKMSYGAVNKEYVVKLPLL